MKRHQLALIASILMLSLTSSLPAQTQTSPDEWRVPYFENNESADEDYYKVRQFKYGTQGECRKLCMAEKRCKSYRLNLRRRQCWLRDKLPSTKLRAWSKNFYDQQGKYQVNTARQIIIGIKMSKSQYARYEKLKGNLVKKVRRKGKEIKRYHQVSTARLCAGLCAMNGQCKSLAYRRFEHAFSRLTRRGKGGTCVLFSDNPKPFSENVFFTSALD